MIFGMFPAVGKHGKKRSCQLRERTANEPVLDTQSGPNIHPGELEDRRLAVPHTTKWTEIRREFNMNPRAGSQRRRSSRTIPMTLKAIPLKNIQRAHSSIAFGM